MTVRAAPGRRISSRAADRPRSQPPAPRRLAWLYCGPARLTLELTLPDPSRRCAGWAILPRAGNARPDLALPRALHTAGFGILAVDLLDETEARYPAAAFDMRRLVERLVAATRWLSRRPEARGRRLSYVAARPSAGAALQAAAELGSLIAGVVSLGGRVDLAASTLDAVTAPTLLVVNRRDRLGLDAHREAERRMNASSRLVVAPSFRYLRQRPANPAGFEALMSVEWLSRHVGGQSAVSGQRPSAVPGHGRAAAAATVLALVAALAAPALQAEAAGTISI